MKKKHLRCLLVLLVAVCMVCSIAVPVCAEVLPSAQILIALATTMTCM